MEATMVVAQRCVVAVIFVREMSVAHRGVGSLPKTPQLGGYERFVRERLRTLVQEPGRIRSVIQLPLHEPISDFSLGRGLAGLKRRAFLIFRGCCSTKIGFGFFGRRDPVFCVLSKFRREIFNEPAHSLSYFMAKYIQSKKTYRRSFFQLYYVFQITIQSRTNMTWIQWQSRHF